MLSEEDHEPQEAILPFYIIKLLSLKYTEFGTYTSIVLSLKLVSAGFFLSQRLNSVAPGFTIPSMWPHGAIYLKIKIKTSVSQLH